LQVVLPQIFGVILYLLHTNKSIKLDHKQLSKNTSYMEKPSLLEEDFRHKPHKKYNPTMHRTACYTLNEITYPQALTCSEIPIYLLMHIGA
jgi:hypothetical protein